MICHVRVIYRFWHWKPKQAKNHVENLDTEPLNSALQDALHSAKQDSAERNCPVVSEEAVTLGKVYAPQHVVPLERSAPGS